MNRPTNSLAWTASILFVLCLPVLPGCSQQEAVEAKNKEIVKEAAAVIEALEYDELDKYFAHNYTRHCQATPGATVESLDDFKALIREWENQFSDIENRVDVLIAEGDLVGFAGAFVGTHTGQMGPFPPTGKKAVSEFAGYHRLENGKIVETWVTWDNMVVLQQLGLLPPPTPKAEVLPLK
ncbi:MAG: ester cyclase [Bacteroidetes bacterium]|nr:ester cyclase [Bacteroidota bacterium]